MVAREVGITEFPFSLYFFIYLWFVKSFAHVDEVRSKCLPDIKRSIFKIKGPIL